MTEAESSEQCRKHPVGYDFFVVPYAIVTTWGAEQVVAKEKTRAGQSQSESVAMRMASTRLRALSFVTTVAR
jgi:hypothetical protein